MIALDRPSQQAVAEAQFAVVSVELPALKGGHASVERDTRDSPERRQVRSCPVTVGLLCGSRSRTLPAREFSLLKAFADHPGQVLSRQELLSMAWGMNFDPGTNLVDVYVRYLRRKPGETVIDTVRGAGYRLRADGQETRQE